MKKFMMDEDDLNSLRASLTNCLGLVSSIKNDVTGKEKLPKMGREKYLVNKEVSDMLGISERTLKRWRKTIDFKMVKTNRCYFSLSQLKKLVDTGTIMLDHEKMNHFMEKYKRIKSRSKK